MIVHGSASDADVSSTFLLRSRDGIFKYAIFTHTSISITSSLIGLTISLSITYFLSVLMNVQDNKKILFGSSSGPVQGRQPHDVSSLQDCKWLNLIRYSTYIYQVPLKLYETLVVLSSTVVNHHCSPNGMSSFVYNCMQSWILVIYYSVVLIAPLQNHLIPWQTYDQPRISALNSSLPIDQPCCVHSLPWDIRNGSKLRLSTTSQGRPGMAINVYGGSTNV